MTTKDEALRIALKDAATSLETISRLAGRTHYVGDDGERVETYMGHHDEVRAYSASRASVAREAITAIKQAQEPVAWRIWDDQEGMETCTPRWQYYDRSDFKEGVHPDEVFAKIKSEALYGAPPEPAPQRPPLTVQEVEAILSQHDYDLHGDRARYIVRMTERAHHIGEGK